MFKSKTGNIALIAMIILAVVAGGASMGMWMMNKGNSGDPLSAAGKSSGSDNDNSKFEILSSETTPDLKIQSYDNENAGTALTEATNLYRLKGTTVWSTFTAGTAITNLEAGKEYEFVMGITTSDMTDNAYGEHFTHTIKWQETETIEKAVYNDEIETSLSATFYNKDDNAAAQTFVAGDNYVVSLRLKAGKDEFFGNPTLENPNVVVLKLNKSEWERPDEVYLANGDELKKVEVPERYDQQATGFTEYAYELPVIGDREIEIFFSMVADDTNAPSVDGTAYLYAGNYFINDEGDVESGVENEDGTAVGTDAPDSVGLDFTA